MPGESEAADRECSFSQNLRKHVETRAPAQEEEGVKALRFAHVQSAWWTLARRRRLRASRLQVDHATERTARRSLAKAEKRIASRQNS